MEKRVILAVVLMVAILFAHAWVQETFFTPKKASQSTPAPGGGGQPSTGGEQPAQPAEASRGEVKPAEAPVRQPEQPAVTTPASRVAPAARAAGPPPPQTTAAVDTPLYRAVVSSEGGKLQEWTLKYRGAKPMVEVGEHGPQGLLVGPEGHPNPVAMTLSPATLALDPQKSTGQLALAGETDPLRVHETLAFRADDYTVEAQVRVQNVSGSPQTVRVAFPWAVRLPAKPPAEKFLGQRPTEIVWSADGHIQRIEDLTSVGDHVIDGPWMAIGSTSYLVAFLPKEGGFKLIATSEGKPGDKGQEHRVSIGARATPTIAPGETWEGRVVTYIGPKEYDRLAAHGLQDTVNFGGFPVPRRYGGLPMEWLGVPILKFMNWLYGFVPNYGAVIILITVVSKVLFFPLTVKSMRSMRAMQVLQPQINNLRNKYRSDPRKLQEETLALYRKHSVNPMGGCLPMVAQVPIFYALYLALSVSVELQGAPFLCFGRLFGVDLWICDLASHDPTYILPILMGISMFVQQKMTPTMGDPRQAKMMLVMPFVFTFMFLNLPAGLVLYWFVSNILQVIQQWWMDRPGSGAARTAKDAARA
jgi:YidC/Oxa1 family membrane protein insertase